MSSQSIQSKIQEANITDEVKEGLRLIEDLKFFLATAPANWQENQVIRRYYLNHDEGFVSCVFWNNLYFITGTDIVRCIVYKFQQFGRKIIDRKKFEEGIFSDLRNLKCGTDAVLELPKSPFLDFLYRNSCLRTQKKQKVFFWFNVPHDKLMADALERDLKKEKMGQAPTTTTEREPALSFKLEDEKVLFKQLVDQKTSDDESDESSPDKTSFLLDESEDFTQNTQVEDPEYLTQDTPNQYRQTDDEDDFPLDYFPEGDSGEYISLDSNFHHHYIKEEDYDFIDNPVLFPPAPYSSQVEINDEYLIEQTLPVKTPLAAVSVPMASDFADDVFPYPLSAKFPRNSPLYEMHPAESYYSMVHEPEYWPYEPNQAYMVVNDMNPMASSSPHHSAFAPVSYIPSARQQAISANMMMKKRQMLRKDPYTANTGAHRVSKPSRDPKQVVKEPKPDSEEYIPTPDSAPQENLSKET